MEKWKDIPGYEGLYQASDYGRIRSHPKKTTRSKRYPERHWKCRIMKGKGSNPKTGYRVSLWKDGKPKGWLVARLVAITWIPGYEPNLTVNHKDGNRLNNRIENLEWLTREDNIRHAFETGLVSFQRTTVLKSQSGESITFRSMAQASLFLGRNAGYISLCLKKGRLATSAITNERFQILR